MAINCAEPRIHMRPVDGKRHAQPFHSWIQSFWLMLINRPIFELVKSGKTVLIKNQLAFGVECESYTNQIYTNVNVSFPFSLSSHFNYLSKLFGIGVSIISHLFPVCTFFCRSGLCYRKIVFIQAISLQRLQSFLCEFLLFFFNRSLSSFNWLSQFSSDHAKFFWIFWE